MTRHICVLMWQSRVIQVKPGSGDLKLEAYHEAFCAAALHEVFDVYDGLVHELQLQKCPVPLKRKVLAILPRKV